MRERSLLWPLQVESVTLVSMENTIQPILCCVGTEVAGEPTQFLMERTCSAAHLDWRVITVEVAADQLQQAWQGMSVMRFRAVRFFQAHQAAAMQLVAEPSIRDRFIGGITSAQRLGDQWTMWHNSGLGLVSTLTSRCQWSESICWLHGDSPRLRSIFVACTERPPRELIWTGYRSEIPQELAGRVPLQLLPEGSESDISELLTSRLAGCDAEQNLIHLGEPEPAHFNVIIGSQPTTTCNLLVVNESPGTRRRLNDRWRAGSVHVLTHCDVVVAEEAYDQARWIGAPANMELLREAYEEYADF